MASLLVSWQLQRDGLFRVMCTMRLVGAHSKLSRDSAVQWDPGSFESWPSEASHRGDSHLRGTVQDSVFFLRDYCMLEFLHEAQQKKQYNHLSCHGCSEARSTCIFPPFRGGRKRDRGLGPTELAHMVACSLLRCPPVDCGSETWMICNVTHCLCITTQDASSYSICNNI